MKKKDHEKIPTLEILGLARFLRYSRERQIKQDGTDTGPIRMNMALVNGLPPPSSRADLIARDISDIEEKLRRQGWKMNAAGEVKRIRGGVGADIFTEFVWEIYTQKYREQYRSASTMMQLTIRKKIAAELAPFPDIFNSKKLNPASGAPIDHVIRKGEKRRQ